jgi:hypothetical protein
MTAAPPADPSPRALGESLAALAAQLADLRSQVRAINERLDQAGLRAGLDLAARFEELARTVTDALEAAAPGGPAAPYWIGLDHDTYHTRLAELRRWAGTVLRQHYGGYELRDCWPRHIHAIWELSTLAAEWHRIYGGTRSDLARALEFHDRWLPGTMRRIGSVTGQCMPHCVTLRGPAAGLLVPDTADTCAAHVGALEVRLGVVPRRPARDPRGAEEPAGASTPARSVPR